MKAISTLLTLLMLSVSIASAQHQWTLTECIEYVHANNIQIKRTGLQVSLAEEDVKQAGLVLLPDLNADYGRYYSFGRQVNPGTNEYTENDFIFDNYSISSSLTLFNGLQNYNRLRQNQHLSQRASYQLEQEKMDKALAVTAAYLRILYQEELLLLARVQRELTQSQVERTTQLIEGGRLAKGDLLEIQAQLAGEDLQVTLAENEKELSVLSLVQLMDLDAAEGFDIVIPDTLQSKLLTALPELSEVLADAVSVYPQLKMAESQIRADQLNLLVQKGRLSPHIHLSGSFYTLYSDQYYALDGSAYPYRNQFRENMAQSVRVGVDVPIFNGGEVRQGISKAKIQAEDSYYALEQAQQNLQAAIQQVCNDARSAYDKYTSAEKAVDSYREAFRYTEQKFKLGSVSSMGYSIAKNNFVRAESQLTQAKYEYIFAIKILDIYRGKAVEL